jgi:hypothetical protein
MARKKIDEVLHETPKGAPDDTFRVEERELGVGRPFFRVFENAPAWESGLDRAAIAICMAGAIVRLDPPIDADEALVAKFEEFCHEAGAAAVRTSPIRRSAVVVQAPAEPRRTKKVRGVVAELVAESNVEDRGALESFCEEVMARNGC